MDEHIIEALGKARVVVRDGKVVEVGEPELKYCPIFDKVRGIKELTREAIAKNIQFRIDDFGMCTENRELEMRDYLSFGISETISTAMSLKMIDAAVIVCEGCGTVIIDDYKRVQGIGGRVSGLVSTTPLPRLMYRIGIDNILDPETARINQVDGAKKAIERGFKNIAVTTASAYDAKKLKGLEREHGVNIYTFVVHTSGMTRDEAELVFRYADVTTGCASRYVREYGLANNIFKVGDSVPVFGITPRGIHLIQERIKFIGKPIAAKPDARQPDRLI